MIKRKKASIKSNKIKELLIAKGMTQQELADRVGTNRAHICKIAMQKSPSISLPIAILIAKELEVSIEYLFTINEDEARNTIK